MLSMFVYAICYSLFLLEVFRFLLAFIILSLYFRLIQLRFVWYVYVYYFNLQTCKAILVYYICLDFVRRMVFDVCLCINLILSKMIRFRALHTIFGKKPMYYTLYYTDIQSEYLLNYINPYLMCLLLYWFNIWLNFMFFPILLSCGYYIQGNLKRFEYYQTCVSCQQKYAR